MMASAIWGVDKQKGWHWVIRREMKPKLFSLAPFGQYIIFKFEFSVVLVFSFHFLSPPPPLSHIFFFSCSNSRTRWIMMMNSAAVVAAGFFFFFFFSLFLPRLVHRDKRARDSRHSVHVRRRSLPSHSCCYWSEGPLVLLRPPLRVGTTAATSGSKTRTSYPVAPKCN